MYQLNPESARQADQQGAFINETGKYVGKFTQAVDVTAKTGTKGIYLTFESNGQTARIPLYVRRGDGTEIFGMKTLNAIMACLSLRNLAPQQGQYKEYDFDAKQEVTKTGQVFPDLCNKPIGLLLETEDYLNGNGDKRTRMAIAGAFQAGTELTASEILERKTNPEKLDRMVANLRHRPLKTTHSAQATSQPAQGSGFEDMADDIPF